jgi:soluble lytic murein transglycosylase-like protein
LNRKTNTNNDHSDIAEQGGSFCLGASLLVIFFLVWAVPGPCRADIYRYIDGEGVVHYTNTPTASGFELYIREKTEDIKVGSVSKTYDAIIQKAQEKYGIAFSLIKAVIHAESGFNPRAVSKKGAKGLMQIMPGNYRSLAVSDPFDPSQNIMGGTRYLKQLLTRYDAKLPMALAAYNAGPTAVDLYGRVPPYTETQNYVQKVLTLYNRYKNI